MANWGDIFRIYSAPIRKHPISMIVASIVIGVGAHLYFEYIDKHTFNVSGTVQSIEDTGPYEPNHITIDKYPGEILVNHWTWDKTVGVGSEVDMKISERPFGLKPYCRSMDDGIEPEGH